MHSDSLHRRLRPLIGKHFDYLDEVWILIDILGDIDAVVLQRCSECRPRSVQRNAFGVPNRRAGGTLTLPISAENEEEFSQDLLLLLSAWGACPPPPETCPADLDGNDLVDFSDLLALLSAW